MPAISHLQTPATVGRLSVANRFVMAPMTRNRALNTLAPGPDAATYYAQRASAGLIVTEATQVSASAAGYVFTPGIHTAAQIEGWRAVTDAVHAAGGRIVLQLWHTGRISHQVFQPNGGVPVSASPVAAQGEVITYDGPRAFPTPRALELGEIASLVEDFGMAARNAIEAGFDGVEIHAANGYLIDQFLRDGTNLRDDDYGGPIANRLRFLREAVAAVIAEVGADRTGIRLSPNGDVQGCHDSDGHALFTAAAAELQKLGVPWIELREPGPQSSFRATEEPPVSPAMRKVYSGRIVLNSDFDAASGQAKLDEGACDAISFGRPFLANPDLVERIRLGAKFNAPDVPTLYSQGSEGYTDYPTLLVRA